ncbi:MAG: hypothetical protein AAF217_08400 [Pseudomonadota bacterium]
MVEKKSNLRKSNPAKALTLKGRKLEDFLPLLPAEEKLRACAALGVICDIDPDSDQRPQEATKQNTIRAGFVRYMILGGCAKSPIDTKGIILEKAFISCPDNMPWLDLFGLQTKLVLELYKCKVDGHVGLSKSFINSISLNGSEVNSLSCDDAIVNGSVDLREDFKSLSDVELNNSKITGNVTLSNGHVLGKLNADNCVVGGNFEITKDFSISDAAYLRAAHVKGNFNCSNGKFPSTDNAILANRAVIVGDVNLSNINAKGTIGLTGTEIGGSLLTEDAVLSGSPALQLRNSSISGTLMWRGFKYVHGEVDLSGAKCATINTGRNSWMRKRPDYADYNPDQQSADRDLENKQQKEVTFHTRIDNFDYGTFANIPDNCRSDYWIEWLEQQPDEHLGKRFKPRPWEQLAGVLNSMGYEEEARDVRIQKQKLQTRFMRQHERIQPGLTGTLRYAFHWLQIAFRMLLWGPLVAYGYRPGNAILWLVLFVAIGTGINHWAAKQGIITPTHPLIYKEARAGGSIPAWCAENWVYFPDENCASAMPSEYSEFNSLVYTMDVALPVVNLRMEDDWAPRVVYTDGTRDKGGWWVRLYEWFLIASGWILSLLFVSAVGSSIRH